MPPQATDKLTKADVAKELTTAERAMDAAERDVGITIPLKRHIEHGGVTYTELEFEPLCGEHVGDLGIDMSDSKIKDILAIGGRQAGVPDGVMGKLGPKDIRNVCDVVGSFLLLTQGTED